MKSDWIYTEMSHSIQRKKGIRNLFFHEAGRKSESAATRLTRGILHNSEKDEVKDTFLLPQLGEKWQNDHRWIPQEERELHFYFSVTL